MTSSEPSRRWLDGLRERARAAMPAPAWTYLEAGAREQVSVGEAASAWSHYRWVPRVLRGGTPDPSVHLLGEAYALPLGAAPTAMQRAAHPEGELATAEGTRESGVPLVVPILAGHPFAHIGARAGSWWLQVYLPPARDEAVPVIEAALAAGASALVLTVDTPIVGRKYAVDDADWRGIDTSWHGCNWPRADPHPWSRDLTFADLTWLRARFGVPVVAKGVLRTDDASACVDAGAAAIWVSNHGGRQLDRSLAPAHALPRVRAAVGPRAEVYVDGGVRSGLDVLTALALGADAAFVGRPVQYGLADAGGPGVARLFTELGAELREAMTLAGCSRPRDAPGLLAPPLPDRGHRPLGTPVPTVDEAQSGPDQRESGV